MLSQDMSPVIRLSNSPESSQRGSAEEEIVTEQFLYQKDG
jgi:hypothetical protein